MTFSYDPTIPNANDYPGDDQPGMLVNAASINSLIAVDHLGFNIPNGGEHNQVTFPNYTTPSPTGTVGVLGTQAGIANSTAAEVVFTNKNGVFPVSLLCAYVVYTPSGGVIDGQKFNVDSISTSGSYVTVINLTSGCVKTGKAYGVIVMDDTSNFKKYTTASFSSAITVTIGSTGGTDVVTVIVFQA